MRKGIRRVVTGHNAQGHAVVVKDTQLQSEEARPGAAFAKIWTTDKSPADPNDPVDGAERPSSLTLPGGTVMRVVDYAPGARGPMHRTQSLDYGILLEGRIDMELDSGEVTELHPGDIVIQRGTNHAWHNPGDVPARMAFVLVDAEPVMIDGRPLAEVDKRPVSHL